MTDSKDFRGGRQFKGQNRFASIMIHCNGFLASERGRI